MINKFLDRTHSISNVMIIGAITIIFMLGVYVGVKKEAKKHL